MPEEVEPITAYMIAYDDQHQEHVYPLPSRDLRSGDLLLLREGERIPAPCKILSGEILVDQEGSINTFRHPAILPKGGLIKGGEAKAYVYIIL